MIFYSGMSKSIKGSIEHDRFFLFVIIHRTKGKFSLAFKFLPVDQLLASINM